MTFVLVGFLAALAAVVSGFCWWWLRAFPVPPLVDISKRTPWPWPTMPQPSPGVPLVAPRAISLSSWSPPPGYIYEVKR